MQRVVRLISALAALALAVQPGVAVALACCPPSPAHSCCGPEKSKPASALAPGMGRCCQAAASPQSSRKDDASLSEPRFVATPMPCGLACNPPQAPPAVATNTRAAITARALGPPLRLRI